MVKAENMTGSKIIWSDEAWKDFEWWLDHDKKIVSRIRKIIKDARREPFEGIGKPEPLNGDLSGLWSRRINHEHRFVYYADENGLYIISVKFHYSK